MELLSQMNDAYVAFPFLHSSLSAVKVNYRLRITPVSLLAETERCYDVMLSKTLQTIIGGQMPLQVISEMSLPDKRVCSQQLHLGARFTKTAGVATPLYLASIATAWTISNALCAYAALFWTLTPTGTPCVRIK